MILGLETPDMDSVPRCDNCESLIEAHGDDYGLCFVCDCPKRVYLDGQTPEAWR